MPIGRQGLEPPCRLTRMQGWQLDAIRCAHFVPFGMSYLSLPYCGVALPPGSSVSSPEARKRELVTAVSLFLPNNFIPGFLAHIPRKGSPHSQMDDLVTSASQLFAASLGQLPWDPSHASRSLGGSRCSFFFSHGGIYTSTPSTLNDFLSDSNNYLLPGLRFLLFWLRFLPQKRTSQPRRPSHQAVAGFLIGNTPITYSLCLYKSFTGLTSLSTDT